MSDRPFTTRAQRVIDLADREAAALDDPFVGAEHLLLGLLAEQTGIAAEILHHLGVTPERVHELLRASRRPAPE